MPTALAATAALILFLLLLLASLAPSDTFGI